MLLALEFLLHSNQVYDCSCKIKNVYIHTYGFIPFSNISKVISIKKLLNRWFQGGGIFAIYYNVTFSSFHLHKIKHCWKPILALVVVEGHRGDVMLHHMHIVDELQPQLGSEKVCRFKLFIWQSLFYRRCLVRLGMRTLSNMKTIHLRRKKRREGNSSTYLVNLPMSSQN
jgi:hypothetical protein